MSAHGTPEYQFNLNLAQDIKQALLDAGFDETVLLITDTAPPMGLFERAIQANKLRADSVSLDPSRFGARQPAADMGLQRTAE